MAPVHILLRHPGSLVLPALALVTLLATTALGASMLAPADIRPKDFAFVKKDGVYHLFYIRHNDFLPPFATENDFGHAISTDLYHWTQLPPVLPVDPYSWDNFHVWAPHIVEKDGLWWMFYTGITERTPTHAEQQRLGLAVSSDLMNWNRVPSQPVWSPGQVPWGWTSIVSDAVSCRDAFVMPDPNVADSWLMYYTASPASDTLATVVGVARSPAGDFLEWEDVKPLWITHRSWTFNALTESPHLFQHGGRWFMFITTNSSQPLSFYTSADPIGEPAQWTSRGRLRNMLGYDTSLWFASESLRDGDIDLFAFVAAQRIELRRIVWGSGDNFSLTEPSFAHMVSMGWTRASVREHEQLGLRLVCSNSFAFNQGLVAWVRDAAGNESPAPLDSLGLEARPSMSQDTTVVAWFARRWPSTLDPGEPMWLRVAVADGSATSPWLLVSHNELPSLPAGDFGSLDPVPPVNEFPPPEGTVPGGDSLRASNDRGDRPAPAPARHASTLRVLRRTPLGGGPAIAFELAVPADVRAEVYDLQGRRIATLAERGFAAGAHVLPWDARDFSGARARRGLYFVRLITPEQVHSARLFVER